MEKNEGMAGGRADSERFANLKLAFSMATHCLLTGCPREEFSGHFSLLKAYEQDALYKLYTQMVVSVQENLQEEFRDICEETRVVDACDDEFLLRQYMDNNGVRRRITAVGRKSIINAKINELESLKQTLQMVKEQNHDSALKLKALKDGIEASDSVAQTDAVMVKLKELNAKLGSAVANKRKLEFA